MNVIRVGLIFLFYALALHAKGQDQLDYKSYYRNYEAKIFDNPRETYESLKSLKKASENQGKAGQNYIYNLLIAEVAEELSLADEVSISLERAIEEHEAIPDHQKVPLIWCMKAIYRGGNTSEPESLLSRCREESSGDPFYSIRASFFLASYYLTVTKYSESLRLMIEVLDSLNPEEQILRAVILNNLGLVSSEIGDRKMARQYYLKAIDLFESLNLRYYSAVTTHNYIADVEDKSHNDRFKLYNKVVALCLEIDDPLCLGHGYLGMAQESFEMKKMEDAETYLLEAANRFKVQDLEMYSYTILDQADIHLAREELQVAIDLGMEAVETLKKLEIDVGVGIARKKLGRYLELAQKYQESNVEYKAVIKNLEKELEKTRTEIDDIMELKYKTQVAETKQSNKVLKEQNTTYSEKLELSYYYLKRGLAALVILAAALGITFFFYRGAKKYNAIVTENAAIKEAILNERSQYTENFQKALRSGVKIPDDTQFKLYYQPAENIGGDWYFAYEDTAHKQTFLSIADVSGHGFGSALLTFTLYGVFEGLLPSLSNRHLSAEEKLKSIIVATNSALWDICPKIDKHVTFFVCIVDEQESKLYYENFGHNPQILISNSKIDFLRSEQEPLGYTEEPVVNVNEFDLESESFLFLYTDGLFENRFKTRQKLRLKQVLRMFETQETMDLKFQELINAYSSGVEDLMVEDDVTVMMWQKKAS